jgi:hypothetical protein
MLDRDPRARDRPTGTRPPGVNHRYELHHFLHENTTSSCTIRARTPPNRTVANRPFAVGIDSPLRKL